MNSGLVVVCPRGMAGEIFAGQMADELRMVAGDFEGRISFAYPYLPEYKPEDPGLLQQISAVVRDGMNGGVTEFVFVDTQLIPVLADIPGMLPEESAPLIYNPVDEARAYFSDPEVRPLWVDRWEVMERMVGFENLFLLDRTDLRELIGEVVWRVRGVGGGNTEEVPEVYKADLLDEEKLRIRAAQLLFKLAEISPAEGIIVGNVDLAVGLTRYIDEEHREFIYNCRFVSLAKVLAIRLS